MAQDISDPEVTKRRSDRAKLERRQVDADIHHVMSGAQGRRFVWWLLGKCRVNEISFDPENDRITSFNEGRRNVGNEIQAEIVRVAPGRYMEMMQEISKMESDKKRGN